MTPMNCWAKPMFGTDCEGRVDNAHLGFRKQTLRKRGMNEGQVWDDRIVRRVCRKHHNLLDGPTFHLFTHQLPPSVRDFAAEHDLSHLLEEADRRHLQSRPPRCWGQEDRCLTRARSLSAPLSPTPPTASKS